MVRRACRARGGRRAGTGACAGLIRGEEHPRIPTLRDGRRAGETRRAHRARDRSDPARAEPARMAAGAPRRRLLPPDARACAMNAVRVALMASAVGKIGGVTWHHLYLVAADASGPQSYLRAG